MAQSYYEQLGNQNELQAATMERLRARQARQAARRAAGIDQPGGGFQRNPGFQREPGGGFRSNTGMFQVGGQGIGEELSPNDPRLQGRAVERGGGFQRQLGGFRTQPGGVDVQSFETGGPEPPIGTGGGDPMDPATRARLQGIDTFNQGRRWINGVEPPPQTGGGEPVPSYLSPPLQTGGGEPVPSYLQPGGGAEGAAYLKANADVASNAFFKDNPWAHYQKYGQKEGRGWPGDDELKKMQGVRTAGG